jgi:hypothetical protein
MHVAVVRRWDAAIAVAVEGARGPNGKRPCRGHPCMRTAVPVGVACDARPPSGVRHIYIYILYITGVRTSFGAVPACGPWDGQSDHCSAPRPPCLLYYMHALVRTVPRATCGQPCPLDGRGSGQMDGQASEVTGRNRRRWVRTYVRTCAAGLRLLTLLLYVMMPFLSGPWIYQVDLDG